jgi:hypothetical protein
MKIIADLELTEAEKALVQETALKALAGKSEKVSIREVYVSRDPEDPAVLEIKIQYENTIRRTRRITGYLADQDRFNAAKLAEAKERRAHI